METRPRPYLAVVVVFWLGIGSARCGESSPHEQLLDDCEGVQTSWEILPSDSLLTVADHRRTDRAPLRGHRCEFAAVVGRRGGDTIYATHKLPPSAVIDEFAARLWVRGNHNGFHLLVRVRLPRTLDERGDPISMLLPGDHYTSPGEWQQLVVRDLVPKLAGMTRVLRAQQNRPIDPTEAYVDMLVLDVFGSAGINRVWLDDLTLEAAVARPTTERRSDVVLASAAVAPRRSVQVLHGRFLIDDEPFVPRGVTYRGEPLAELARLGFNTVWLSQVPTRQLVSEAQRHQLWLICPPPSSVKEVPDDRVLCWCIDRREPRPNSISESETVTQIHRFDPWQRPIALATHEGGNVIDAIDVDVVIQSGNAADRNGNTPSWKVLGEPLGNWSRWLPLREEVYRGLEMGRQGFLLQTASSLALGDAVHTRRLAEMLNAEVALLGPWTTAPLRDRTTSTHHVSVLSKEHSSLALVRRTNRHPTYGTLTPPIDIADHARRDVFLVEPGGLSPARHHHVPGGIRVSLRPDQRVATLLITDRAGVIEQLNRHLRQIGPKMNNLLMRAAREELLNLDRRIDLHSASAAFKSDLRNHLHSLQSHFAAQTDMADRAMPYRELEQLFWQLEEVQVRLDKVDSAVHSK